MIDRDSIADILGERDACALIREREVKFCADSDDLRGAVQQRDERACEVTQRTFERERGGGE